ncbi:tryptophan--tRNA ligase [Sorangium sp. So ce269]
MSEGPEPSRTYAASLESSYKLESDLLKNPSKYKVLTGDRATGRLHVGHLFGSLLNRVRLADLGVTTYIVIADYQVLTDRDAFEDIADNVFQLAVDYLACGIKPSEKVIIFPHSHVPELNQLFVPFLTLVSRAELDRNPTVKEEIQASGRTQINAGMYTYPVHQAADILFCKGEVVPVGKDQLPHLELTRTIARRFNAKFGQVFPEPEPLLSQAPLLLGLDGAQKMSKSRSNAVMLSATEDETVALIRTAKTDATRSITYSPEERPEVSNLLFILSLVTGQAPAELAAEIGDRGAKALKDRLSEALNEYLRPIRSRRKELERDRDFVRQVLRAGIAQARAEGEKTLAEVRAVMHMDI